MHKHKQNFIEALTNTFSGFTISVIVAYTVLPLWGFHQNVLNSIEVTLLFTSLSLIRNFVIRTVFDKIKT